MATRRSKQHTALRRRKPSGFGEVTIDDVILQLLDLFNYLGLNARKLAARVAGVKPSARAASHRYPQISAIGELLTEWHQNPEYLDRFGEPLPIRMNSKKRSFRSLAGQAVPNMDPHRLLSELKHVNAVVIAKNGSIRVQTRSLPVYVDRKLAIQHTLTSLDSFVKMLRHNLHSAPSNSNQLFHRIARIENFDADEIATLKVRVKKQGQSFLESCDNWMARRKSLQRNKKRRKVANVSIGVYMSVDK